MEQHTEGRSEESKARLDLGFGGIDAVKKTVGKSLGVVALEMQAVSQHIDPPCSSSTSDEHESHRETTFSAGIRGGTQFEESARLLGVMQFFHKFQ